MQKALLSITGVMCQMDGILIHSQNVEAHGEKVQEVLQRSLGAGITLNPEKCEFNKSTVVFLGCVIDAQDVHADQSKVEAI